MAKRPIVKPKKAIAALQRADFFIDHQTGSHARLQAVFKVPIWHLKA